MKKLLLMCMMALSVGASAQITVGSGNTTNGNGPWSSCWGYSYHQQIYAQPAINAAGTITSLTLTSAGTLPTSASGATPNDPQGANNEFKIYLGHTTKANFASTTDWEPVTNLTLVYDGTLTMPTTAGQQLTINLTTPFVYNNTDNLVIAFDENSPGYACTYTWVANSAQTNMNLYYRNDTTNPDPASPPTGTRTTTTPQVILGGLVATSPPPCVAITAPANAATGVSVTPTITWPSAGGASSYDLAIGTTAGGTDVMPLTDVGNVTSYAVLVANALAYNSTYYVTVYPKNGLGTAAGCTSNMFTTANISCPTVTAPVAAASGQSLTPTFTWNAVTNATGYFLTIGTTSGGSDIVNNMSVGNVTSYTYNGSPSLSSNTIYYYTINATDGTNTSASCTVRNFTTVCNAVMAPYTYDVENAANTTSSVIGNCWSSNPSGTTSAFRWDVDGAGSTPSSSTGPSGANSGVKYFYTEASSGATGAVAELYSPFINVTALTNPILKFYYHMYGSTMGELHVDVYDGAAWINDLLVLTGQQQTAMANPWTLQIVNLNSLTITGNIQVRFRGIRGTDFYGDMSIDDISIIEAPSCLSVSNLMVDSFTSNSAMVSWTAPSSAPSNGYQVYYSTTNTAPDGTTVLDATNSVTSTTTSATINSLIANTTYYIWVRSDCGTGKSAWTGSVTAYTGYCTPAPSSVDGSGITNVTFGNSPNVVNNTTVAETGNYGNYSTMIGDVPAGVVSQVSITYATGFTYDTKIWVDLNNNLVFEDAEALYTGTSTSTNPTTLAASITIPASTPLGTYRMRIGGQDTGPVTSCYNGTYGTFEDYTVNVTAAPSCLPPSGLASSAVTATGATLSWTAPATAPANGYEYAYSTTNTTPTSGTATTATSVSLTPLTPATTYYYWVRSVCSGSSTSTWISGSFTTPATPPANDVCSGAIALTPGATFAQNAITTTNVGATTDGTTTCQSSRGNNVWYSVVVPASGSLTIETDAAAGSPLTDTVLSIHGGACGGTFTDISCDDDTGNGNFSKVVLSGQTPGETLYVSVWRYTSNATNLDGQFQISAYDASLSTSEIAQVKNNLTVYPNPFADVLNISDVKNVKSVSVIDIAGRLVKTIEKPNSALQLGELKSGMYMIVLNMNDGSKQTIKAIKK